MLDKLYITPRQWLRILRWTMYSLLFLTALLVQTVVLGNRTLFGTHPTFVPLVITCVCLREGAERGGLFALSRQGITKIVVVCSAVLNNRFLPCLALSFLTLCCDQILCFAVKFFLGQMFGALFVRELIPCVFVSILCQPLIYWLVKCIAKIGASYEST